MMDDVALHVGDPAPTFDAPDETGRRRTLEEFSGRYVVLYFYPKDDTPGCTIEACGFRDNIEKIGAYATVLGVSADSVESHQAFKEKYGLPYALLADQERSIIDRYGTNGLVFAKRTTFVIGPDGHIKKIYEKVDPEIHADQIIKDLQELTSA